MDAVQGDSESVVLKSLAKIQELIVRRGAVVRRFNDRIRMEREKIERAEK